MDPSLFGPSSWPRGGYTFEERPRGNELHFLRFEGSPPGPSYSKYHQDSKLKGPKGWFYFRSEANFLCCPSPPGAVKGLSKQRVIPELDFFSIPRNPGEIGGYQISGFHAKREDGGSFPGTRGLFQASFFMAIEVFSPEGFGAPSVFATYHFPKNLASHGQI